MVKSSRFPSLLISVLLTDGSTELERGKVSSHAPTGLLEFPVFQMRTETQKRCSVRGHKQVCGRTRVHSHVSLSPGPLH